MVSRVTYTGNSAAALARMRAGAATGLQLAAEEMLGRSNAKAPIEEGTLIRSGVADVKGLEATVSYDTPYAVVQHEDLTFKHDAGRQAKFLEQTVNADGDALIALIATAIRGMS